MNLVIWYGDTFSRCLGILKGPEKDYQSSQRRQCTELHEPGGLNWPWGLHTPQENLLPVWKYIPGP